MTEKPTIYIGADHRGFALKSEVSDWLRTQGYTVTDCGNHVLDPNDDYPDFCIAVGQAVVGSAPDALGIVLCGSGVGAVVAANKVKGVRASSGLHEAMVRSGRHDDDFNTLVIAADYQSLEEAQTLISAFIDTEYELTERYQRRLDKIAAYEQSH